MGLKDFKRYSNAVTRTQRWKALRIKVLDRDNWKCVQCSERRGLECDHVLPVRTHPELSYDLNNIQCLCGRCHARKTRLEIGHKPLPPERQKWRNLVRDLHRNPSKKRKTYA